ncbi:hypothetical protein [Pseudarthrobacter sp. LT1]|uniref:sunset domain-containing protein n=1 Tax=Pseudarthrobacter sp. LT1 TaxID=3111450 RepID=UPI002D77B9F1|nr:hypothetical protein [Pseudarthrobacter sp. LT1]WRT12339.1 hypothetical protein VIK36_13270 [Pseudarthrobacter sp. LT1]
MDIIFWIIVIAVIAVIIWWLVNRNKSANAPGGSSAGATTDRPRADGALEGGSAAASAAAAGTTGIPTAAGFGKAAEPAAPATAEEPADSSAMAAKATGHDEQRSHDLEADQNAEQAEWETQWSEAGSGSRSGSSVAGGAAAAQEVAPHSGTNTDAPSGQAARAASRPVHHDEYTAPHAPTLPGAETAAVEGVDGAGTAAGGQPIGQAPQHVADSYRAADQHEPAPVSGGSLGDAGDAETLERAQSSALVENGADHHQPSGQGQDAVQGFAQGSAPEHGTTAAEPAGHLAADEPYGAGSAAPGPDGSGPADYTVKGDAAAMVYYEEGHPDYEQTRAEVWFESAAHAEAAGFRAPRRRRL